MQYLHENFVTGVSWHGTAWREVSRFGRNSDKFDVDLLVTLFDMDQFAPALVRKDEIRILPLAVLNVLRRKQLVVARRDLLKAEAAGGIPGVNLWSTRNRIPPSGIKTTVDGNTGCLRELTTRPSSAPGGTARESAPRYSSPSPGAQCHDSVMARAKLPLRLRPGRPGRPPV